MKPIWRADRGKYYVRVGGKLKSLETNDLVIAQERVDALSVVSFASVFRKYLQHLAAEGAPRHWRVNISAKHIERILVDVAADAMTPADLKTYVDKRRAEGISDSTIFRDELADLSAAMKHSGLICPPFKKPPPNARDIVLPMDVVKQSFELSSGWFKTFMMLAVHTGGRKEAILELVWDRVDFTAGTISLTNPDKKVRKKLRATVKMSKAIRDYLLSIRPEGWQGKPIVTRDGVRPVKSIRKALDALRAKTGCKDLGPHVMRHSIASHMVMNGVPIKEVSIFLGHSSVAITERVYAKFLPEYMDKSAGFLNSLSGEKDGH